MTDHSTLMLAEQARDRGRCATEPELAQAHRLLLDALACAAAAISTDAGRRAIAVPYAPDAHTPTLADQAAALAILIHLEEFDALHDESATCPALVAAAAVQLGVRNGRTLDAVLRAIVAGAAVTIQTGALAGGPSLYKDGIWPSSLFAALGAAAVGVYLLDLPPEQAAHAFAITSLSRGNHLLPDITEAHYLSSGTAVRQGLEAAWRAQQGMRGPLGLLDERSFAHPAQHKERPADLADISFKRYPCARPLHSVADGVRDVILRHDLRVEAVDYVAITLPRHVLPFINNFETPALASHRRCSVSYVTRLAMVGRADQLEGYRELIEDLPDVPVELLPGDEEIDELYPHSWPARVRVGHGGDTYELIAGGATSSRTPHGTQVPPLEDKWAALTAHDPWKWGDLDVEQWDSVISPDLFPSSLRQLISHGV